jgi:hypothetical protein
MTSNFDPSVAIDASLAVSVWPFRHAGNSIAAPTKITTTPLFLRLDDIGFKQNSTNQNCQEDAPRADFAPASRRRARYP